MKFLISLIAISLIAGAVYFYLSKRAKQNKKQNPKKINRRALVISSLIAILLLVILAFQMYRSATAPDTQCITIHTVASQPPGNLTSAMDYYLRGNYDYDTGNCQTAINDYTKSIGLNPEYPQSYNNRAYTYMRLQNYKEALPDLDKALDLNPNYIQALMNRGDIHNYYYAIDRQSAIADYQKVISLGGLHGTSVCGHLFMARNNGWNLGTILDFPRGSLNFCN